MPARRGGTWDAALRCKAGHRRPRDRGSVHVKHGEKASLSSWDADAGCPPPGGACGTGCGRAGPFCEDQGRVLKSTVGSASQLHGCSASCAWAFYLREDA